MPLFGKLTFSKLIIFGNNINIKWWILIDKQFSVVNLKRYNLFSIEKSISNAYFKKIKLLKSPLTGDHQILKRSEPSINSWDNSNKKRILTGCQPGADLYTLRPSLSKLILFIWFFAWMIFSGIHRGSCGQKCEI